MFVELFSNKKKLIIVIAALVIILGAGGFATYYALNKTKSNDTNSSNNSKTTYTQASADALKDEGVKALSENNSTKAKSLFVQAKEQYQSIGDKNGEINVDSLIFTIEHTTTN